MCCRSGLEPADPLGWRYRTIGARGLRRIRVLCTAGRLSGHFYQRLRLVLAPVQVQNLEVVLRLEARQARHWTEAVVECLEPG